jgi:hypothetical protein
MNCFEFLFAVDIDTDLTEGVAKPVVDFLYMRLFN